MKPYEILKYTFDQAKRIGVEVKPSTVAGKKIDVFKAGKKVASIGALGMMDYPYYIKIKGLAFANERRRLYKQRHEKDRHIKYSNGWYADQLLW